MWRPRSAERKPGYIPPTDARILDFSSSETPEARLCKALVSERQRRVLAAVGSGGVGKTTLLCALGSHPSVEKKFDSGIWFIELGQQAEPISLLSQLRALVPQVCPDFLSEFNSLALHDSTHRQAVVKFVSRLSDRHMLLLLDDIWESSPVYALVTVLLSAIDGATALTALTSTRALAVSRFPTDAFAVHVGPREAHGDVAKGILRHYSGGDDVRGMSKRNVDAFENILGRCAGLPLALAIAGRAVYALKGDIEGGENEDAWDVFWGMLQGNVAHIAQGSLPCYPHGLFESIATSISVVSDKWPTDIELGAKKAFEAMCVLSKQTWTPLEVCRRAWRVSIRKAEVILGLLADLNLVTRKVRSGMVGLRMHDLLHAYSVHLASSSGDEHIWHAHIVEEYGKELPEYAEDFGDDTLDPWWEHTFAEEGYLHENLGRHMVHGNKLDELLSLLVDFRWIQKLNSTTKFHAFHQSIRDTKLLVDRLVSPRRNTTGNEPEYVRNEDIVKELQMIREAMELCAGACTRNPSQTAFALYSRLQGFHGATGVAKRLLCTIGKYAKRPWIKGGNGLLREAGTAVKRILPVGFAVGAMASGPEENEMVIAGLYGGLLVIDRRSGAKKYSLDISDRQYSCVAIDLATGKIYASSRGNVFIFVNRERERCIHPFGEGYHVGVSSLLMIGSGALVCASYGGWIRVFESGDFIAEVQAHSSRLVGLAGNKDGRCFASSSADGRIKVWALESNRQIVLNFESTTQIALNKDVPSKRVLCIGLSPDASVVACGDDEGDIHIWDCSTGQRLELIGPRIDSEVRDIRFSPNGRLMFAAGRGFRIRLLLCEIRSRTMHVVSESPSRQSIWSLMFNEDGSELYTGSQDGLVCSLRVGRLGLGADYNFRRSCFASNVQSFAVNMEGNRIAILRESGEGSITSNRNADEGAESMFQVIKGVKGVKGERLSISALSRDMERAAFVLDSTDMKIYVAKRATGELLQTFTDAVGHTIFSLRFSLDGRYLVAKGLFYSPRGISSTNITLDITSGQRVPSSMFKSTDEHRLSLHMGTGGQTEKFFMRECESFLGESDPWFGDKVFQQGCEDPVATLDDFARDYCYVEGTNEFWILTEACELHKADIIVDTPDEETALIPRLPAIARETLLRKIQEDEARAYDVFISHAGPDKYVFAMHIYKALQRRGIASFLDEEELRPDDKPASAKMLNAIQTTSAGIFVLSPEFGERKWTMRELEICLERNRRNREAGVAGPVILPVFYRLTWNEAHGDALRERYERARPGCGERVVASLKEVSGFTGIRNDEGLSAKDLAEVVAEKLVKALKKTYGE